MGGRGFFLLYLVEGIAVLDPPNHTTVGREGHHRIAGDGERGAGGGRGGTEEAVEEAEELHDSLVLWRGRGGWVGGWVRGRGGQLLARYSTCREKGGGGGGKRKERVGGWVGGLPTCRRSSCPFSRNI